jgi:hypothetical protein
MATPKQQKPKRDRRAGAARADAKVQAGEISGGAVSLHQLFEQQTRRMLDRTDLDEEQKQNLLVAMSCPCCGAGAMSYTVKLKR